MASMLVKNAKFEGSVVVSSEQVKFRANGRKNAYAMNGVRDNGRTWSVRFGRYGWFTVRKRVLQTLDKVLLSLFETAREMRSAVKKTADAIRRQQPKEALRNVRTPRRYEQKNFPAWEAFKNARLGVAA